jgi:hypothetical protein
MKIADLRLMIDAVLNCRRFDSSLPTIGNPHSAILLDLPMHRVPPIEPAVFLCLDPVGLQLLVARRRIVATLAFRAGQYGKIPWHRRTSLETVRVRGL